MYPPWTSVDEAAHLLKNGQVVAIPTETVYGLAGDVFNANALAKIFEAKERPTFDPLIVHISKFEQLSLLVKDIPEKAKLLAKAFWPGPMTLIFEKKECVPDLATSALPSVAVRFPSHPIAQEIIEKAGTPLAAPSANLFKHVSPTTAQHVADQLANRIAGIVDGGASAVGVESTIISLINEPTILRPGAITQEMIEEIIGPIKIKESSSKPGQAMEAPGQCDSHYKPNTPLFYGELPQNFSAKKIARIAFGNTFNIIPATLNLSPSGNLTEATANLYAFMHDLDLPEYDLIFVDEIPNEGLGRAINDRLKRAAVKYLKK